MSKATLQAALLAAINSADYAAAQALGDAMKAFADAIGESVWDNAPTGGTETQWWADACDFAHYGGEDGNIYTGATNTTLSVKFAPIRPVKLTGMKFWAPQPACQGKVMRCSLWDPSGTRLEYVETTVGTDSVVTVPFASAYTLNTAINKDNLYTLSLWSYNSGNGWRIWEYSNKLHNAAGFNGPRIWVPNNYRGFGATGDVFPTTNYAPWCSLIDPILEAV